MRVSVGVESDVGRVRSANEDSYLLAEPLFVIADGMGGHVAGDVASSTAVQAISDGASSASAADPGSLDALVGEANGAVWRRAQSDSSLRGMGTTCTLLLVDGATAYIAHVGDSRAYILRAGRLEQLTDDHTLVARMVREGKLRPEDAEHHPQRNVITRVLGVDPNVKVDLFSVDLLGGDRIVLCSDGLSSMVAADRIRQTLSDEGDPQRAAELLVDLANEAGGEDNITCIVVDVLDGAPSGQLSARRRSVPPEPPPSEGVAGQEVFSVPSGSGRWLRRLVWLLGVAALVVVAVVSGRYALDHSWYLGVNQNGFVTVYRGIPDEIAGVTFSEVQEVTNIAIADLPQFKRPDVREQMRFHSLEEARATVSNLERLRRDFAKQHVKPKGGG